MRPLSVASTYEDALETVFSAPIAAKAWLASVVVVLAVLQVLTGSRIYGHLGHLVPLSDGTVGRIHRWSGRVAVIVSLPVVFHCVFFLGFQTSSARVAIHSIVGSFLYGVLACKLLFVRSRGYPSWVIPLAGGTLFAILVALWSTSSLWYFTEVRFGF